MVLTGFRPACGGIVVAVALLVGPGCRGKPVAAGAGSGDVTIATEGMAARRGAVAGAIASAPERTMAGSGIAGAVGGARVKVLRAGDHELLIPLPQLTATQVPLGYAITVTPADATAGIRLRNRDGANLVVAVGLEGERDREIVIDWAAVLLTADADPSARAADPEPYLEATACVQSGADEIAGLARQLWPDDGGAGAFAPAIRQFIAGMKQERPPRTLDAAGILGSGGNWICTANANLAAALLRAKGIPARSIAVIPTNSRRLEMHRVVEYVEDGRWTGFDPSGLTRDIPLQPWHGVVMAVTTVADENLAMKPRMGAARGCPYGQELEVLDPGLTPCGQDFFWTLAKPLAEFEPGAELVDLARGQWRRFLESGKPGGRLEGLASLRTAEELAERLQRP